MNIWILVYLFMGLLGIALIIVAILFLAVCYLARDDKELDSERLLRDGT